jgi:DDE superfamily endonuclease
VARERRHWRVWQRFMDPARFVFLDETGTSTNMVRRYGRCPRGERLVDATPWGHWKITTFVAGLRASGLIAPIVLDGPMNGEVFRAYVEQVLVPELQPGDGAVCISHGSGPTRIRAVKKASEYRQHAEECRALAK